MLLMGHIVHRIGTGLVGEERTAVRAEPVFGSAGQCTGSIHSFHVLHVSVSTAILRQHGDVDHLGGSFVFEILAAAGADPVAHSLIQEGGVGSRKNPAVCCDLVSSLCIREELTAFAEVVSRVACCLAGSCLGFHSSQAVRMGRDNHGDDFRPGLAAAAGIGHNAFCSFGGLGGDHTLAPFVGMGRDNHGNGFRPGLAATAGIGHNTLCSFGGFGGNHTFAPAVAGSRNDDTLCRDHGSSFLIREIRSAVAVEVGNVAAFGTARIFGFHISGTVRMFRNAFYRIGIRRVTLGSKGIDGNGIEQHQHAQQKRKYSFESVFHFATSFHKA